MSPHDHESLSCSSNLWEACEAFESSSKNSTLEKVLIREKMLSHLFQVSSQAFPCRVVHAHGEALCPSRPRVNELDHLQDGWICGLVDEL